MSAFAVAILAFNSTQTARSAAAGDMTQLIKQKIVTDAVCALLDNQLPLKLDASAAFPTVVTPPGGRFDPKPLRVTAQSVNEVLPPGDYTVRAMAFCSEYSVHRAGAGVAYQVGPIQGCAAEAIAALYWRGTMEKRLRPRSLLSVGWAIQGGVTYAKMTKPYQAIVDDVIPDFKNQLGSDFVQNLQDFYATRAKAAGLPPLNTLLAQLGKPGELVISANRQRQALLRTNTNDQIKDQVLFAGQEQRMAAVKPEEGPWSERIPGIAYVRYRVVGGNVRANNEIQIRVLPAPSVRSVWSEVEKPSFASYLLTDAPQMAAAKSSKTPSGPSVHDLTSDGIGYSTSRAAQVLYFVPVPDTEPKAGDVVGKLDAIEGNDGTLTRDGKTQPLKKGDEIRMGDTLTTGEGGRLQVRFADNTELTLAAKSSVRVDDYLYSPSRAVETHAAYSLLKGGFKYVGGELSKRQDPDISINTPYGNIGPRGTEFFANLDPVHELANIKLINGKLECSPRQISTSTTASGPVTIEMTSAEVRTSPLTRQDYDAVRPSVFIR